MIDGNWNHKEKTMDNNIEIKTVIKVSSIQKMVKLKIEIIDLINFKNSITPYRTVTDVRRSANNTIEADYECGSSNNSELFKHVCLLIESKTKELDKLQKEYENG